MNEHQRVLIVDDDLHLRAQIERYLLEQGFQVRGVANAEQMDRVLHREPFQLILLDVTLPSEDGLSICRRLRNQNNLIPIVILTEEGHEVDSIIGLEMGADGYLDKPLNKLLNLRLWVAYIRAVLRRQSYELPGAPAHQEALITFGRFRLNLGTREMFKDDLPTPLSSGEFAVLKVLGSHPREPFSRDKLMNLARGREYKATERSIDVQISRLRRIVEEDPVHPRYIQTVWGLGYVFVPDGPSCKSDQLKPLDQPKNPPETEIHQDLQMLLARIRLTIELLQNQDQTLLNIIYQDIVACQNLIVQDLAPR